MKNLAGFKDCDEYIKIELEKAKLTPVEQSLSDSEVPYKLFGKVGNWTLKRAWYYWMASTEDDGLPIDIALEMHNKKYPDEMYDEYCTNRVYGDLIRVGGHCGSPSPDEFGGRSGFVTSYHIDSQEGLNEFVRVIKELNK